MKLSNEITRRVAAHIEEVRKHLKNFPADERQEILQSIESHIYDALQSRSDGEPTPALLDAVLAEMDPPESYGERLPAKQFGSVMKPLVSLAVALTAILGIWLVYEIRKGNTATHPVADAESQSPPIVISTVPEGGNNAVDPNITELRVTFNKDMLTDRMWSWCTESQDTAPAFVSDKIRFVDKRTCVAAVELEPDRTYVVWINTQKHNSFRDVYHNPAVPYRLEFRTGHAQSNPCPLSAKQPLTELTIGRWVSVDFVSSIEQFDPEIKSWRGGLDLKELTFLPDGKTDRLYWTWADGILHHSGDNTDAKFLIKRIGEKEYLFLEWMSGDVLNKGLPPKYYVLRKENPKAEQKPVLHPVPFEQGCNSLKEGDSIVLTEVLSTSQLFAEGDVVAVKGHYTLASRSNALLALFVTGTRDRGNSPVTKEQRIDVARGTGEFTLTAAIPYHGCAHVTFYDKTGGTPLGGFYFGTKEQLEEITPLRN